MSTGSEDLRRLVAVQAITEVLHRYCRGVDRMDRALARSCWHADGTADYGELYEGPADGLLDRLWSIHAEQMSAHSHQVTNVLVDVDLAAGTAVSESYVTVALRLAGAGKPLDVVARGRYLDRWSVRDERWALDHRLQVNDLTSVHAVDDPSSGALERARRDPADPSYEVLDGST